MKLSVCILISLLLTSCDIFETRVAEPPDQSGSNFQPAIEPETLISNMINSFNDKDAVNYLNTIVSDNSNNQFTFVPSSSAFSRFPGIWQDWGTGSETTYFNSVASSVPEGLPMELDLSEAPESLSGSGDNRIYISNYEIKIPQSDGIHLIYKGNVEFKMINENTEWRIYYWKDNAIENQASWSDLKGLNY